MKHYKIFAAAAVITFFISAFESKAQLLPIGTVTTDSKYRSGNIGIGLSTQYSSTVLPAFPR